MTDETCFCGGTAEEQNADETPIEIPGGGPASDDRWIDRRPVTDGALPADVAAVMSGFYTADAVETVGDFVDATRADAGGGGISVEELCHVDGESPHVASTPGETYHFRCFFDGVALSLLVDEPVEIRTESPGGEPVEVRASPDGDVESTPPGVVISFGIDRTVEATSDGGPDPADVYAAVCPYVKVFPSRERYEGWAAATDAATVAMPLEAGMPVAQALTEEE